VLLDGAQAAPTREWTCANSIAISTPSRAQDVRADGMARCMERQTTGSDAPLPGGGEHDRIGHFREDTYNTLPYKFEAGTPNIAGTLDYLPRWII